MLDVLVSQVKLDRARVLAGVGEIEAGSVAEHVGVHGKLDSRSFAGSHNHVVHVDARHRSTALGREHIDGCPAHAATCATAESRAANRMRARRAVLSPVHVHRTHLEIASPTPGTATFFRSTTCNQTMPFSAPASQQIKIPARTAINARRNSFRKLCDTLVQIAQCLSRLFS
jgi:hypothetical protein